MEKRPRIPAGRRGDRLGAALGSDRYGTRLGPGLAGVVATSPPPPALPLDRGLRHPRLGSGGNRMPDMRSQRVAVRIRVDSLLQAVIAFAPLSRFQGETPGKVRVIGSKAFRRPS